MKEDLKKNPNTEVEKFSEIWDNLVKIVDQGQNKGTRLAIAFKNTDFFGTVN